MNLLIINSVFMCFRIPICRVLGWGFVVWTADVTHRHFHHPTFMPNKVSPKHSRLRSFRETSPLCKSVGNRRNWWHHGCQSWTLWFVSRKAICFVHAFFYRLRAWNMISGLKKFLPEISAASQSGFYFFQCLMTKRRMRGTCCSRF